MLCHTPHHTNNERMTFPHSMQSFQSIIDFLFRIVPYRTSIQKYSISFIKLFCNIIARHFHDRSYHFAISYVHLTSIGLDK